ncbi:conserved hypothetical protein [Verticillium alfalfae VaMs.102]|uniref:Orc1-like AAA ATPase domain-containing protein n=1 Tax=Verticillium alfalfae (strain VaMs.102 / ATCC MYA-4576 / FGSC 10136) TaxID=526221 RepID=C9SFM0_VERA1|nr:conserved hypothetical protein [Verticillium alfalfae VaMs.102]EEY17353.1 conserved hypothetical protein [Verticillium alfalfae VaMs.102]
MLILLHAVIQSEWESDAKPASAASPQNSQNGNGELSLPQKMLESAATSFASILVLAAGFGIAGYAYHKSYKRIVLNKMANAFEPGDPVLDLAAIGKEVPMTPADMDDRWVNRPEQLRVDQIVQGEEVGHYHLLIGDKGTGKSSMLIEAMRKIDGDGVAMFEAHADLEIVRIRLGKALDFEFHEDYIGGYFSERGPRDTTALLDIERALNKLEKVALLKRAERKKPLVLIINQMHLIRDDDDGKDLIELLQQRAEQWAAANLVTMVFNSDDFWVYERLKQLATRMEVIPVLDLPKAQASIALQKYRVRYFGQQVSARELEEVYDLVEATTLRIADIESLGRQRELVAKDLVLGGHYEIAKQGSNGFTVKVVPVPSLKTSLFTPPKRCTCQVRQNWIDDVSSTPPPIHPPAKPGMHADLQLPHLSHAHKSG